MAIDAHHVGQYTCFNPLPSPKRGEIHQVALHPADQAEFQSAPLTEARGDSAASYRFNCCAMFQSAPLTEARGDAVFRIEAQEADEFQSAPLTEARGDLFGRRLLGRRWSFNPLPSPKRGEIRAWPARRPSWVRRFQSAPLTEARGDFCPGGSISSSTCFNPLPSPKRGEMGVAPLASV